MDGDPLSAPVVVEPPSETSGTSRYTSGAIAFRTISCDTVEVLLVHRRISSALRELVWALQDSLLNELGWQESLSRWCVYVRPLEREHVCKADSFLALFGPHSLRLDAAWCSVEPYTADCKLRCDVPHAAAAAAAATSLAPLEPLWCHRWRQLQHSLQLLHQEQQVYVPIHEWMVPKGGKEAGESWVETARREFREEAGRDIPSSAQLSLLVVDHLGNHTFEFEWRECEEQSWHVSAPLNGEGWDCDVAQWFPLHLAVPLVMDTKAHSIPVLQFKWKRERARAAASQRSHPAAYLAPSDQEDLDTRTDTAAEAEMRSLGLPTAFRMARPRCSLSQQCRASPDDYMWTHRGKSKSRGRNKRNKRKNRNRSRSRSASRSRSGSRGRLGGRSRSRSRADASGENTGGEAKPVGG
jgi:8-oxo-dGTP pyrophosphatase MutT (NUDIX family)